MKKDNLKIIKHNYNFFHINLCIIMKYLVFNNE